METKKAGRLIISLIIIIVILLAVIVYTFLARPAINGYIIQKQIEAKDVVLNALLSQIQQQGYARITDAEGNSVLLGPAQVQPEESSGTEQTSPQENAFTQ